MNSSELELMQNAIFTSRAAEGDSPAGGDVVEMIANEPISIPKKPGFMAVKIHDPKGLLSPENRINYYKKPGIIPFIQRVVQR